MTKHPADLPPEEVERCDLARSLRPLAPCEYDLTPALRLRYGKLLREEVLSVRHHAENRMRIPNQEPGCPPSRA